ncbi:MAG: DEAD/DEAH box helicase, partial [Candidatus Gracilibacteria bacterium]|nr:DEAD/DEAH box helicase [Candidatus Gracilibacteria bacterium]
MKQIENKKHYINSGNIFSKTKLLNDYISKNPGPVLIFVSEEEKIPAYEKISKFVGCGIEKLENYSQLVEYTYNTQGYFISDLSFFEKVFPYNTYEQKNHVITLEKGAQTHIDDITQQLHDFGYTHSKLSSKSCFSVQGDTLSLINYSGNREYRISFWDNIIEDILIIQTETRETQEIEKISIGKIKKISEFGDDVKNEKNGKDYIHSGTLILDELDFSSYTHTIECYAQNYIHFHHFSQSHERDEVNLGIQDLFLENIDDLKNILNNKQYVQKHIFTKNERVLKNFIEYNNIDQVTLHTSQLNNLKSYQTVDTCVICDDNISRIFIKKRVQKKMSKKLDLLLQIKPGDYVVHVDHGIGIFREIIEKELQISPQKKIRKEYIALDYKNDDKLFIPITEVGRINKYVGVENPKLTGLSTKEWEKKLKKINENVEEIAHELLDAYANRRLQKGHIFPSQPKEEMKFFHSFPYTYTSDQMDIIRDIYSDMESDKPMDRLVAGDVGFGKTEIAFAAIYKAIISGKQAALISPLVVLTYEHFEKAIKRFSNFPFHIGIVTRFETKKSIERTLQSLKEGKIDLIIGTHRLLSSDIQFKDLGVLVIDEEHKFGVKDKDNITQIKENVEVLSLSATPIPRSLNMALNGIKSMSILQTPPVGRKSIETLVSKYDEHIIKEAGKREFERHGQLFFIHNKVSTIESFRDKLGIIFPTKKIIIAHGQLAGDQLEKRIIAFKKKEYDILLATTVIENGIDFPNVNTIFINDAYNFGISQIHQLRGRVGRSDKQGYCYLLFQKDKIKEDAAK